MDRLAREGVHFRNAFVTFSLCSPSRATMLSGKDVRTHGVNRLAADVPPDCEIFPALLRQAGYDTGYVGKWHLGRESDVPDPAFNHWAGVRDQAYIDPVMNINGRPRRSPAMPARSSWTSRSSSSRVAATGHSFCGWARRPACAVHPAST
jgi:arylsulfatase A-like enzyme